MRSLVLLWGLSLASVAQATPWQPLLDIGPARQMIESADISIIDIRHHDLGFARGHIPGSVSMPLWSWRGAPGASGTPPDTLTLSAMAGTAGLEIDRPVLIVHSGLNATSFASAAWVYWVLKSTGFQSIAILNGGIRLWKASGGPISTQPAEIEENPITLTMVDTWTATTGQVARISNHEAAGTLLDSRSSGQTHPATIKGAMSYAITRLLEPGSASALAPLDTLEQLKGLDIAWEDQTVVTFCINGLEGAAVWFMASEVAGVRNVRLYAESLEGWQRAGTN